ncbi:MFS transporter [Brevibacterium casei]|uniref:MFS transporter n=1 Tax=Brevibacterium casei TaxID=33889 RepID=UPI00223A9E5D|nr:MFS transporter [Brevibacterium casei]MCT2357476.1 MFS transporter [Brevibacterium casei]
MSDADAPLTPTRPPVAVSLAAFVSSFDRFAVSPLLVLVAADLGVSLSQALVIASAYFLAYGVSQPVWGILSDRVGRIRLMRLALVAAAVVGVVAALAPTLTVLIIARTLGGAFYGAIVPTSLTYVGDTVDEDHRQSALADLMAAIALGTALATALAGILADVVDWRVAFAVPAALAVLSVIGLSRVPESHRESRTGILQTLRTALGDRWVRVVIVLVFVEGAAVLGVLTLLAPALQSLGVGAAVAGLATAAYGVGVIVTTRMVRPLSRRLPMPGLMVIGGSATVLAFVLLTLRLSIATVIIAAFLLGATWSFLHSSLQTWSTSVLPQVRGTVVSLFAGFLFAGSALGAWAGGVLGDHGEWTLLFAITAVLALVLTVAVVLSRRAYERPRRA